MMATIAEVRVLKGKKSKEKIIKDMKTAEKMANIWLKISKVNKKSKGKGFTSIQIPVSWPTDPSRYENVNLIENPKTANEWRTIDIPKDIEFYLLMRNRLHFGQAHGTPFIFPPLLVEVDWAANLVTSELILEGGYTNDELSDIEQLLIQHCRHDYNCDMIKAKITKEEWQNKIAVWDKHTPTSPSGQHHGHFKALLDQHQHDTSTDEGQQSKRERTAIID
eukprot:1214065-Ditylum_brightwellii.AAC.1